MLLKFAYDGSKFYGYQRQKDLPTVEGEILKVIKKYKIADNLRSASRTDRGVSALGNVIWLKTEMDARDVIGILNSNLKYIYFHSFANENINPRHAELRWYRYHIFEMGHDFERLKEAAKIFQGFHDFRNFTRARKNTEIEIKKIEVKKEEKIIT
jgi:tRNA pseudouridine38-40 synthase